MLPYFVWNGVDCRTMGLAISTPPRVIPEERVEQITVPGRPGAILRPEGVGIYAPYVLTIHAGNRGGASLQAILSWLRGPGTLILSSEPNRAYEARVINAGQLDHLFRDTFQGDIQFFCQPLRAQVPAEADVTASSSPVALTNPGDVPARALYSVTGTGEIFLLMDGARVFEVVLPEEEAATVLVDTAAGMTVTSGGENYNNHATGSYRGLWIPTGAHSLAWEGSLTALTVTPRWRWI